MAESDKTNAPNMQTKTANLAQIERWCDSMWESNAFDASDVESTELDARSARAAGGLYQSVHRQSRSEWRRAFCRTIDGSRLMTINEPAQDIRQNP
jgi:hypothetical protein